jgi:hypothetical protein
LQADIQRAQAELQRLQEEARKQRPSGGNNR